MPFRYENQVELAEIGPMGQKRFANSTVVVAGAGGLGSTVLPMLVGAGIGHVVVFDHDKVELHNLHRQTLYQETDIGKNKALAAKSHLEKLNSTITITAVDAEITKENISRLLAYVGENTIIVDCGDSFELSYALDDFCQENDLYFVSGSAIKTTGYCGVFYGHHPYRMIFPDAKSSNSCSSVGIMNTVVGTVGMMQSQLVLDLCLGKLDKVGKLFRWNSQTMKLTEINFGGS